MTADEEAKEKIKNVIKSADRTADGFTFERASQDIRGNIIFYVEYKSKKVTAEESLYYALVDEKGAVKLYDDGISAVAYIHDMLERRRSLIQRLNEFTLVELVGAAIALTVTAIVVGQAIGGKVDERIIGVFGIILGYYFGKTVGPGK